MRKISIGIIIAFAAVLIYRSCIDDKQDKKHVSEQTMLIQQELKNVAKLVVTEGHFAEVYNYKDSQKLLGDLLTAEKKALIVVNAKVNIAYDLNALDFEIDEATKTVTIISIPEPELTINPDFEYYDISADYFNRFTAEDHNTIKEHINTRLLQKIEASGLKENAKNRLLTELSKFYVLTRAMGWTLQYQENTINTPIDFLD